MFKGIIKQSSKTNKAIIDQEEWINELKRFDYDRIHSTTNLRTTSSIQPSEEPSFHTTRTTWPLSETTATSSSTSLPTSSTPTSSGKPTPPVKVTLLTDSQPRMMGTLSCTIPKTTPSGHQAALEREMPHTLYCWVTREIWNGMEPWGNSNGNLDQPDIDLLTRHQSI